MWLYLMTFLQYDGRCFEACRPAPEQKRTAQAARGPVIVSQVRLLQLKHETDPHSCEAVWHREVKQPTPG